MACVLGLVAYVDSKLQVFGIWGSSTTIIAFHEAVRCCSISIVTDVSSSLTFFLNLFQEFGSRHVAVAVTWYSCLNTLNVRRKHSLPPVGSMRKLCFSYKIYEKGTQSIILLTAPIQFFKLSYCTPRAFHTNLPHCAPATKTYVNQGEIVRKPIQGTQPKEHSFDLSSSSKRLLSLPLLLLL